MPAGSDSEPPRPGHDPDRDPAREPVRLPHTWRPFGVRVSGAVFGGLLVVVCAVAWWGFPPEVRARFTAFQRGTLLAMGLAGFAAWHALVRSRVVAEEGRLIVVNGYRRHEYAWAEVVAVRLPRGAPWATLDLADGTVAAAMGIQGSDGARAKAAVRQLRALIDADG